jgi:uncharacterized membrane protein SirB2
MIEFYSQIKLVHVGSVLASGGLFFVRGLAAQLGATWAMAVPLRYVGYTIDLVLLTAAMMLASMLHQDPFVHGWVTAKVLLLVVYVVLARLALRPERTAMARTAAWLAALGVYAMIYSVARAHDPLGVLSRF